MRWPIRGCAMSDIAGRAPMAVAPRVPGVLRRLAHHRAFVIGFTIVMLLALAALLTPLVSSTDPTAMQVRLRFRPPSSTFWYGTDQFGRDVFTRVLYGARVSMFVGFAVCVASGLCSAALGVSRRSFAGSMRRSCA